MYGKCQTPSVKLAWSHYFKFFTISDERKRSFYEKDSKIFGAFVFCDCVVIMSIGKEGAKLNHDLQINQNAEQTYHSIRNSIVSAQHRLSAAVNSTMVITYWEIGEQIYKACGENDRAEYGKKLLDYLSEQLTVEFGKGFTVRNLRAMRQFYCLFPIRHTLCAELSWSHYRLLMRVQDEQARTFYAEECAKSAWSVRQLERQINTMYYQRILASQDKSLVAKEIQTTEPKPEYEKIIKDPYVMEFLQIQPDTHVYEGELEQALIDHLQHFLLELGRGFSFVARQKRFTLDGQDFFIDYSDSLIIPILAQAA